MLVKIFNNSRGPHLPARLAFGGPPRRRKLNFTTLIRTPKKSTVFSAAANTVCKHIPWTSLPPLLSTPLRLPAFASQRLTDPQWFSEESCGPCCPTSTLELHARPSCSRCVSLILLNAMAIYENAKKARLRSRCCIRGIWFLKRKWRICKSSRRIS